MKTQVAQTSIMAFEKILPKIADRQTLILETLNLIGEATDAMISASNRERLPINCITPRRNELVKKGLIQGAFKGICKVTKGYATFWMVTEKGKDVLAFKSKEVDIR